MKLTVVFTVVTLALCCYSASALLVDTVGSNVLPTLLSVPIEVLKGLIEGVQGCVNELSPEVVSALTSAQALLGSANVLG
ncbi:secretoglobin family 3A member 2 isoform X4 [Gopherus flavomarginatus]|uniref:secretoglobin family 3A member 2 isoform X3 n=1 Tax=Gopherus flavomarginatus TaxID=286002 RepID=UPI0021CC4342|nr:secretoglobin family 3A member 2 isoform X3 [Gopherus flavomarginatus]XP_050817780.1 secretoglobin family 3A member 2 isoform X4 [Gopherus flavomarginatus]